MEDIVIIIVLIATFLVSILAFCCKALARTRAEAQSSNPSPIRAVPRGRRIPTNQQEDIFNISSRVQGQGQWPTHNAHVSLDYTITNEINKYNDAPPSYEEVMNIAASNNTVVPAVPKTTVTPTSTIPTTTTSTSTSTTH